LSLVVSGLMAKKYLYNLLLTLANIIFPILTFPYVSHVLGPKGVGEVQFTFTFAQYFGVIAGLGIPIYGFQQIARFKDDLQARSKAFSEMMIIYVAASLIMAVLYIGIIYLSPYFANDRDMYWAALPLVVMACTFIDWVYTGLEEFKAVALRSVLFKLLGLIFIYTFIKTGADSRYYLYVIVFSYIGNNLLNILLLRGKVFLTFSNLNLKQHIKPLLFIFATTITVIMADTDTVLLGFITNHKIVGYYAAADKLSTISIPVVTSLSVVVMPKMVEFITKHDLAMAQQTLRKAFKFVVFLGVPIAVGIIVLTPQLISLFLGNQFYPSGNSLRLLSVLPLISGMLLFFQNLILIPAGKNSEMFKCTFWGLVMSLLLNFALIPFFQQMGASIANVLSEIAVVVFYFVVSRKYFSFTYPWQAILKALISSLFFFPIAWGVQQLALPTIYMLLVSVICCIAIYTMVQTLIFKNDLIHEVIDTIKEKIKMTKIATE